jgi:hypothetical protein
MEKHSLLFLFLAIMCEARLKTLQSLLGLSLPIETNDKFSYFYLGQKTIRIRWIVKGSCYLIQMLTVPEWTPDTYTWILSDKLTLENIAKDIKLYTA